MNTNIPTGKDQPLQVIQKDGRIEISVGIETLKYCYNRIEIENFPGHGYLITDAAGFADDIIQEMRADKDDGTTPLDELLDLMVERAKENGSIYLEEYFAKA